ETQSHRFGEERRSGVFECLERGRLAADQSAAHLPPIEPKMEVLTWYEFFAGGGMARIGMGPQWTCSFANEWCEKKAASYRAYFGGSELRVCDVADLRADDLSGA